MTDVEITVRGSHRVTLPPEQATVYLNVSADGPASEPVVGRVAQALAKLRVSLQSRYDADRGPVTRFSIAQISKGSHRPYNRDGEQLPLVHTAGVSVTATFTDFDELASWVDSAAATDGVGVTHIDWALTDDHKLVVERQTRQEAVRDAQRRAQDYADALELGKVRVRTISDPGTAGPPQPKVMMARAMSDSGNPPQLSLQPDDVEVNAQVEAAFIVNG